MSLFSELEIMVNFQLSGGNYSCDLKALYSVICVKTLITHFLLEFCNYW